VVLGFELRALYLLGKAMPIRLTHPAFFCFSYFFLIKSCVFCLELMPDCDSPTYAFHILGSQVCAPWLVCWLRWGSHYFFLGMASKCDPPDCCLLSRWESRHEPPSMIHRLLFSYQCDICSIFLFYP
jgi:hypothetical protein